MDEREHRLALNEALFRDVNERVAEVAAAQGVDRHEFDFLCECSNVDCTLRITMNLATYEAIRSDPHVFAVAPGHELPEIERVVARREGFSVVRKEGDAATLAEEHDRRS